MNKKSFNFHFATLSILVLLFSACSANREKQIEAIEEHEQAISTLDLMTDDQQLEELLSLYRTFAKDFPNDSLAPVYLTRAADMSISLGKSMEAVGLLDTIINIYPDYEDIGGCWFLKGYAYETAGDFNSAREAYMWFVEHYPDHALAADTRTTLPYLGMSPEEMLEAILGNE